MSSQSTIFNKQIETSNNFKITRMEESKIESYVLRKHLNYQIPNCFLQKDFENVPSIVSPLKQNIKSQNEELQKLLTEINSIEEKVSELKLAKKLKHCKIDELRKIIERIADEDSFDNNSYCVFNSRIPNRFMAREKNSKSNIQTENSQQQSTKKRRDNNSTRKADGTEFGVGTENGDDSSGGAAETTEGTMEKKDGFILCWSNSSSNCYSFDTYNLEKCLLFWQEHLPQSKGITNQ